MKRKLVLTATLLALLFVLSTSLATNVHAATMQSHPSSSPDFYTLQKTCKVVDVYLHGTQNPTMACAQTITAFSMSPQTEVRPCNVPGITMEVDYNYTVNNTYSTVCFIATGYWGYRINDIKDVYSPNNVKDWFLWYPEGTATGHLCNINASNNYFADFYLYYVNGNYIDVDITQISPGAQNAQGSSSNCGV